MIYCLLYPTNDSTKPVVNEIYFKQKVSKLDKLDRTPIFLEFSYSPDTLVFSKGEKCKVTEWDTEKQKFRRSMADYQEASESLERLRGKLRVAYRDARNGELLISNDMLRSASSGRLSRRIADLPTLFAEYATARSPELKSSVL